MSRSSYLKPDTVALHTGYVPESDHGSRAVPGLPDDLLRIRECQRGFVAVQRRTGRAHLQPHHQPDGGGTGAAHRRARRRQRRDLHRFRHERAVYDLYHAVLGR